MAREHRNSRASANLVTAVGDPALACNASFDCRGGLVILAFSEMPGPQGDPDMRLRSDVRHQALTSIECSVSDRVRP